LRRAIRHSVSFDLFRSFHDDGARNQPLRALPFGEAIRRAAARHGVDALLIAAVVEAESGFDPRAVSHRGAVGLMQIMPAVAAARNVGAERLTEPQLNLGQLLELYDGDLALALAAYNAGPGNVRRFGGLPPFRETRRFVEKVLGLYVAHHRTVWRQSELMELLG
jgi:soluble lytic murein transglycosylase-like protein